VKTSARGRLFSLITLEQLELQTGALLLASDGGLIDDTEATGCNHVLAVADLVVTCDLHFIGGLLGLVVSARPFVLERSLASDPGATESAFNHSSSLVVFGATDGANFNLAVVDVAFVDDVVFEIAITIVQTFAVIDASHNLGRNSFATNARAGGPGVSSFERVSDVDNSAVFDAFAWHQAGAVVGRLIADEDEIFLVHLFVQRDAFSLIDAAGSDTAHVSVIEFLAGV